MLQASWHLCEFECLSSKSEVVTVLRDELRKLGWKEATQRPFTRAALPETWEGYLKQLSAKERAEGWHSTAPAAVAAPGVLQAL